MFLLSWVESLCFELTNQNCLQMIDYQRAVKPYLADHFLSEMVPFRLLWVNVSLWVIIISEVAIIFSHALMLFVSYNLDEVITNVSGAIDAKYRQIVLRSVLVHKPLNLGYISIWPPSSNGNWCDDCGWHWYSHYL